MKTEEEQEVSKLDQEENSKKEVVSFTPTAEELGGSYAQRIQQRKESTEALKVKGPPVGGAPPIERGKLDRLVKPNFGTEEVEEAPPPDKFEVPAKPPIAGVGAAYKMNHAIVNGETDGPITLREGMNKFPEGTKKPKLSPETEEGLKKLAEANKEAQTVADETTKGLDAAEEKITELPFDFAAISSARDELMNKDRKKLIEARLQPLDMTDLISKKEINQVVPIIKDKLHITLRTYSQREYLFCLRYIYDFPGPAIYQEELLNTCKLVCSLVAINGAFLPDHRINVGKREEEIDRKAFENKMFHVSGFPVHLMADISVQVIWFSERVGKLFSLDNLKNG
jgi:hypothetical protein